jgi:hypothetical protein
VTAPGRSPERAYEVRGRKMAEPKPAEIVDDGDVAGVTAELVGETPEFPVDPKAVPRLLSCFRVASRGRDTKELDFLAKASPGLRVVVFLKNSQYMVISVSHDVVGPLLFAVNSRGYARTNDGKSYHRGDHVALYGHPEFERVSESNALKAEVRSMYRRWLSAQEGKKRR